MDYARQQRDPTRHMIGIAFVVLMHVLVIWALVTGLARKACRGDQEAAHRDDHRGDQAAAAAAAAAAAEEDRRAAEGAGAGRDLRAAAGHSGRRSHRPAPVITAVDADAAARAVRDRAAAAAGRSAPAGAAAEAGGAPRHRTRMSGDDPVYPREAIRAGVRKGPRRRAAADRREGQRDRGQHLVVGAAARVRPGGERRR